MRLSEGMVVRSSNAIDRGLVVRCADPLNCETPVSSLMGGTVMSNAHFYVRNHFAVPALDMQRWRLRVGGLVSRPLTWSLQDLLNLPSECLTVTLECAGNGRSFLKPAVSGEQWGVGAVGTAEWSGVPLAYVLQRAGVKPGSREVVFRGADGGSDEPAHRFERSLTIDSLRESEALVAYAMNGEPLPPEHGYPLRLIVPGWYGVASVKWLTDIDVIDDAFRGHFQTEKYIYEVERDGRVTSEPVRRQRVRSLITQPGAGEAVRLGALAIRGLAWSGVAPIARVEVRIDDEPWQPARLLGHGSTYMWQRWELIIAVDRPRRAVIRARATDSSGRTQPDAPEWNRAGYGNNAVHEVAFLVKVTT
jgi:DMSO/TMAO reductase YedYZ molybdopterin-dependent catalytic subunit